MKSDETMPTMVASLTQPTSMLWSKSVILAATVCTVAVAGLLMVSLRDHEGIKKPDTTSSANGFTSLLSRYDGSVSVVLPDTSTMMINYITDIDISAADYASSDFPKRQIDTVKDPEVRRVLTQLSKKRNTTVSEAKIGYEFLDALTHVGAHGTVRYARDLHVRDLNEGSTILIGSQRSNPWVSLFTGKTNFQYMRNPADGQYIFQNMKPLPGEQVIYPISTIEETNRVDYVDISFMPNSIRSGFVLLIVGTDLESNEAAGKLLLHGGLPPELSALIARNNLRSFEMFLRGKHIMGESEDSLELLSIRSNN